jgi:hypothetical protein
MKILMGMLRKQCEHRLIAKMALEPSLSIYLGNFKCEEYRCVLCGQALNLKGELS